MGATKVTDYSITVNAAVTLSPASLPGGDVGTAYSQTIIGGGGTGTISLAVSNIQNAVAGLVVPTSGTGALMISGTPTATGTETFTVTATDSVGGTKTLNYSIALSPAVTLSPSTLPGDTVNVAYNQTITGGGGTGTIGLAVSNIQNAVAGLVVPASGTGSLTISGTPTATGTETFTVTATDPSAEEDHELLDHGERRRHTQPGHFAWWRRRLCLQPDDHRRRRHRHHHPGGEQCPE